MADGGFGEAMLLNAVIGGGVSAATGQDPLKGALMGGLMGGLGGGLGSLGASPAMPSALFGTAAEGALANGLAAPALTEGVLANSLTNIPLETLTSEEIAALTNGIPAASSGVQIADALRGVPSSVTPEMLQQAGAASDTIPQALQTQHEQLVNAASQIPRGVTPASSSGLGGLVDKYMALPIEKQLLYGGAASLAAPTLMSMFKDKKEIPGAKEYDGPLSKFHYNPSSYTPTVTAQPVPYQPTYKNYRTYASGGIANLGNYSDGGQMLKGPGDGMSDDIPATIANKQPARLANDEFVVPADVVSHLGNGSSDAGAKQLYKMMDRVRQARTGTKKQGKQINPEKYLA